MPNRLNQNHANIAISNLMEKRELGDSDNQRLQQIRDLIQPDGALNMGQVLQTLYPHLGATKAQAELRKLRGRIKGAAEYSEMPGLQLKADSRKRSKLNERTLWWEGEPFSVQQQNAAAKRLNPANVHYAPDEYVNQNTLPTNTWRIFVSYAHANAQTAHNFIDLFKAILKEQKKDYACWMDNQIKVGEDWHQSIQKAIQDSDAGLLLVSPDFLQRDYIKNNEVPPLLEKGVIYPVGLQQVDMHDLKDIAGLDQHQLYTLPGMANAPFFTDCLEKKKQREFVRELIKQIDQRLELAIPSGYSGKEAAKKIIFYDRWDKHNQYDQKFHIRLNACDTDIKTVGSRIDQPKRTSSTKILDALFDWLQAKPTDQKPIPPLLAILGEFGTGKTFTSKMFSWQLLDKRAKEPDCWPLPVYIDLRLTPNFADNRLPTLEDILAEPLRLIEEKNLDAEQLIQMARTGEALVIFDGLDEKLTHYSTDMQGAFLRELWRVFPPDYLEALNQRHQWEQGDKKTPLPDQVQQALKKDCRIMITCRDHFFRTQSEQNAFLQGYLREARSGSDYQGWQLLPLNEEQIREYLQKRFGVGQAERIQDLIDQVHDLSGLSNRPITLNLIGQHIPELEEAQQRGEAVNAARLYRIMVERLVRRDDGKHHLLPRHKQHILQDLAAHFWRNGWRSRDIQTLEEWLEDWLQQNPKVRQGLAGKPQELLDNDLRNSTLLVRSENDTFRFAHTSMQEYFLACYLIQAVEHDQPAQWDMQPPSEETLAFLGQLLALHRNTETLVQTLSRWKKTYHAQTSELLFHYALFAQKENYPTPNLQGFDLQGAQLADLNLTGQDLSYARFNQANLRNSKLQQISLYQAELDGANLNGADWRACNLRQTSLIDADLTGVKFYRCDFSGANLNTSRQYRAQWLHCALVDNQWPESVEEPVFSVGCEHPFAYRPDLASVKNQPGIFTGHSELVNTVAFVSDGNTFVSASDDRTLRLWDIQTGECLRVFEGHEDDVNAIAFAPDGRFLASASEDNTLRLWDVRSGDCLHVFEGHQNNTLWEHLPIIGKFRSLFQKHKYGVNDVVSSPDGQFLISASGDKTLRLWSVTSGECLLCFEGHQDAVMGVAITSGGRSLVSASLDNTLRLWDVQTGKCLRRFEGHESAVTDVAFASDSRYLISASWDKTLRLWDTESGECLRIFQGHKDGVMGVAFSPDDDFLVSASIDCTLLWDVRTGDCLRRFDRHGSTMTSAAFTPDGRSLVSAASDGTLRLWDVYTGECMRHFDRHKSVVTGVAFAPDGRSVVSASDDCLCLWEVKTSACIRRFEGHQHNVTGVTFAPDSCSVVSASNDHTLCLWDAQTGDCLRRFAGHESVVTGVACAPNSHFLVSASWDKTLRLWDMEMGECLHVFEGHQDWVTGVAFAPDGRSVVSASNDCTLRLWDIQMGECLRRFKGHESAVAGVAIAPDGCFMVSASIDSTLCLWDLHTGDCLRVFEGHHNWVEDVAFALNGKTFISASADHTLRLWDPRTGDCLRRFEGHENAVTGVAFAPDGRTFASSSDDQTLRCWDIETGDCLMTCHLLPEGQWLTQQGLDGPWLAASPDAWPYLGIHAPDQNGCITRYPVETWHSLDELLQPSR